MMMVQKKMSMMTIMNTEYSCRRREGESIDQMDIRTWCLIAFPNLACSRGLWFRVRALF